MVIKVCVNEPCNKVSTYKNLIHFLFSMVSKEELVSPPLFICVLQLCLKYVTRNTQENQFMVYGNDVNFFQRKYRC